MRLFDLSLHLYLLYTVCYGSVWGMCNTVFLFGENSGNPDLICKKVGIFARNSVSGRLQKVSMTRKYHSTSIMRVVREYFASSSIFDEKKDLIHVHRTTKTIE